MIQTGCLVRQIADVDRARDPVDEFRVIRIKSLTAVLSTVLATACKGCT
jgi:hypothetical protein